VYFSVNFDVFFKLIKVYLLVTELYSKIDVCYVSFKEGRSMSVDRTLEKMVNIVTFV